MQRMIDRDVHMVLAAQTGDKFALDDAINHFRPLVLWVASGYHCDGLEFDDLVAHGLRGAWEGIMAWRPNRGAQVIGFLLGCIRREVWTAITAARSPNQRLNHKAVKLCDLQRDTWFIDEHTPERAVLFRESHNAADERLKRFREELSGLERVCLDEVLLRGRSYADVASELGCRVKSVDNAVVRIKAKWFRVFGRPGRSQDGGRTHVYRRHGNWYNN